MAKSAKKVASEAVSLDTGRIEKVEFHKLGVSPLNVRKNAEVGPDDELVASIRAHGLLQPLVGYIAKSGTAMISICAGQRRLLALGHIAQPDTPVPVRIVDEETAIEVSLAENLERKDMNPVDELAAFQALIATGHYDANRIADRFGFDRRYVRRRIKMGVLVPEILEALREGKIGIAAAEAYAATDDAKLQLKIFKAHCRPNAWQAHEPTRILREILGEGIKSDSRVAKFIGGVEAYEAEGGKFGRDDAFGDLFKSAVYAEDELTEVRLMDFTVINNLLERARKAAAKDAEKLAREKFPFITDIEWMDPFGTYGPTMPKLPKKSDLQAVEPYYNMPAEKIVEGAAAAAKEPDAKVIAMIAIDQEGKLYVEGGRFLITRTAWAKAKPKEEDRGGYRQLSPEEEAARDRQRKIDGTARNLYARSLIGETPGFEVSDCSLNWNGNLVVSLRTKIEGRDDVEGQVEPGYGGARYRFKEDVLAPFVEKATGIIDADIARKNAQNEGFETTLAELEKKPIAEWPAAAVITIDADGDTSQLIITRIEEDGNPVLNLVDGMQDAWTSDDVAQSIEIIRDQAYGDKATIEIFDTAEAFAERHAGTCRMCGCSEPSACVDSERDEDWSGPCAWADGTKTLCDNPDCLAKAGVAAPAEALEAAE